MLMKKKFEIINCHQPRVAKVARLIKLGDKSKMIYLMVQKDSSQCGVCAIYNLLKLANIETDQIDTNQEPEEFMNQTRSVLNLDDTQWLKTSDVSTFLNNIFPNSSGERVVIGQGFNVSGGVSELGRANLTREITEAVNSKKYYGFIVNQRRHYITIASVKDVFISFDSITEKLTNLSAQDVETILKESIQYFGVKN